jgi:Protein of unknown function (DUF4230)
MALPTRTEINAQVAEIFNTISSTPVKIATAMFVLMLTFIAGAWLVFNLMRPLGNKVVTEDNKILLERIQKVCKLVTVEGTFSDIYSYQDYQYYDVSPFRKKALIVVNAKVMVGLDLTKAKFKTDQATKTLTISQIPKAEIMSIDPDLRYYDITEGTFNQFSATELTTITRKAKEQIKAKAEKSELLTMADTQSNALFEMIEFATKDMGWTVQYDPPRTQNILKD